MCNYPNDLIAKGKQNHSFNANTDNTAFTNISLSLCLTKILCTRFKRLIQPKYALFLTTATLPFL